MTRALTAALLLGVGFLAGCGGTVGEGNSSASQAPATLPSVVATPSSACAEGADSTVTTTGAPDNFAAGASAQFTTQPDGLQYAELTPGTGAVVASGQCVTVQYTGWLADGTKFDSSRDRQGGFQLIAGSTGQVITGWQEGIPGIKVGGKRRLVIPPTLAYGAQGQPPTIPANATLTFDIEVLRIH